MEPKSYRPVALLSCVSKVFERLVHEQLFNFCLVNGILPDEQYGFVKGRSAEWQLLSVLEKWHISLDNHHHVHSIFVDAAKAFDRVDHTILLETLSSIGVGGISLQWFHSYLSNRLIQTKVEAHVSKAESITSGVPQGSVLGPLLFLLHFKDIPAAVSAPTELFADDTLLYRHDCRGAAVTPCCDITQNLQQLSNWTTQKKVSINPSKSLELVLGPDPSPNPVIFHDQPIPRVKSTKHLGVMLSASLNWHDYIPALIGSVSSSAALCKLLAYRHKLPSIVMRKLYIAFVRSKLEYCSAVWCGASISLLRKLERVQIEVARAISGIREPSTALSVLNLPTLSWRRRIHCLSYFALAPGEQ